MDWGSWVVDLLGTLVGAGFGALIGATLAFKYERRSKQADILSTELSSARLALIVIAGQLNTLIHYRRDLVEPYKSHLLNWLAMPADDVGDCKDLVLKIEDLSFVLGTEDGSAMFELILSQRRFFAAIEVIQKRSAHIVANVQGKVSRAFESSSFQTNEEQILELVGFHNAEVGKRMHLSLCSHVDGSIEMLQAANRNLLRIFKDYFPRGTKFHHAKDLAED